MTWNNILSLVGVTTDNFFTSIPLAEALLCKKLMHVGTLQQDSLTVPTKSAKEKEINFWLRERYYYCLCTGKKKQFYFYQLNIMMPQYMKTDRKPEIIQHYNKTKGGVDLGDMMASEYSCVQMTIRWPLRVYGNN
ncbi:hypothetical protein PR048_001531 [Dryococelus australis]|uniref:PiggyBac transposable element-derived protein domain-containing protein n=1 Tax=Dryococelus australis TaxID=614101 RepID=A0ABQ9IHL6_9NEOP|nr:hypothetical protein PR048_001531 [Dryococelus australis]